MRARYPLFRVNAPPWEILGPALKEVVESGYWAEGEVVAKFEDRLREFFGTPHLFATSSCTAALAVALRMACALPGRQVICPPMTCIATAAPVVASGAKVVWGDVQPDTGLLSAKAVSRAINDVTAAVMAVYWGGDVPDMQEIRKVCDRKRIPLIADMAQALGADRSYATLACYSFQAIKHLTTGDGGCVVCESAEQAELGKRLSWFGIDRKNFRLPNGEIDWDQDVVRIGFKANMNNVAAAFGMVQMSRIGELLETHRRNAAVYEKELADIKGLSIPIRYGQSAHWVFTILHRERDALMAYLAGLGIQTSKMHARLDRYSGIPVAIKRALPGTDSFSSRHLCLPCGWWMTEQDVKIVCQAIRAFGGAA
jgi:dTDP-4-amino-4,6-dideoxygalactose transaminase